MNRIRLAALLSGALAVATALAQAQGAPAWLTTAGAIAFAVGVPVALPLYASEPGAASYGTAETWHDLRPLAGTFNGTVGSNATGNVLANDADPEGAPISVTAVHTGGTEGAGTAGNLGPTRPDIISRRRNPP